MWCFLLTEGVLNGATPGLLSPLIGPLCETEAGGFHLWGEAPVNRMRHPPLFAVRSQLTFNVREYTHWREAACGFRIAPKQLTRTFKQDAAPETEDHGKISALTL